MRTRGIPSRQRRAARSELLKRLESSPLALAEAPRRNSSAPAKPSTTPSQEGWVLAGDALRAWTSSDAGDLEDSLSGLDDIEVRRRSIRSELPRRRLA